MLSSTCHVIGVTPPGMSVEKLDLWVDKVRTLLKRTLQRVNHLQSNGALPAVRLGDTLDPVTLLSRIRPGPDGLASCRALRLDRPAG